MRLEAWETPPWITSFLWTPTRPECLHNGAAGFITEIIWALFLREQIYATAVPSVRVNIGTDGIHVIKSLVIQFPAKYSYGTVERRILPLIGILSSASTVHKMQGNTVGCAVVYLRTTRLATGQAYVTLSRISSLNDLTIEELDCSKLSGKVPCDNNALVEMHRMRNVN
ncbi:hypothetical protein PR048_015144 [Dryococelus australis]|uniref:ATP-dependent DNA helicase n=1 Tax=Dryococelus australis TaxID=614101 RepID=A0ABQ9HG51_9NEOP|nr:hypothetical protein PR048_015144 [Dryococelus australis]